MDEGPRPDAEPAAAAPPGQTLAQALRSGFDRQGPALLYAPDELERLLVEQCPRAGAGIALILIALEEHVPQALLGTYADDARSQLAPRLADALHTRRGVERDAARWAVETWSGALHIERLGSPRGANAEAPAPADDHPFAPPGTATEEAPLPTERTALWSVTNFRTWHGVVGIVAVIGVAAALVGLAQNRMFSRSDSDRVLDALSATHAPSPDPASAAVPPAAPVAIAQASPPAPAPQSVAALPAAAPPPVAVAPPAPSAAIFDIAVPTDLVTGKRFMVTIGYRAGDRPPLSIERRAVDGAAKGKQDTVRTPVAKLSKRAGTLRYPFAAVATPSRRTFEFALVDVDGRRSAPKRVVVEVVRASAPTTAVACSRDTCGSVQSVRAIDGPSNGRATKAAPARRYEVVVRMDDRSTRTVVQVARPGIGARVRWAAGKLTVLPKGSERNTRPRR